MARILYIGESNPSSTSQHRAKALERLGHNVEVLNPYQAVDTVRKNKYLWPFHYRTGYRFLQGKMKKWSRSVIQQTQKPDLIWVNSGELLGAGCLKILKNAGCPIVLYNNDDPTGGRDGRRFDSLLKAIPFYDLCAVLREQNVEEYKKLGAKDVMRVYMSYDEVVHAPFESKNDMPPQFISDIAFIGTWMNNENRDKFLLHLIKSGLSVNIWGGRWQKSPLWEHLAPHYKGGALGGRDYVAAIQGAKMCIGLLSKGNRDLHTRRSVEIPYTGGLLCGERTSEHTAMFKEGQEAVFWDDEEECARVCAALLSNEELRESIRIAGMNRVRSMAVGNEDIGRQILQRVLN
jgi:spore maturation protein CgeB